MDQSLLRSHFPILKRTVHGHPICYLDNAATTLKPQVVMDALSKYYTDCSANVHRGIHALSEEATAVYEGTRKKLRTFLNAKHVHEVIFTSGTTDSINLVAQTYGRTHLKPKSNLILSQMEHHSNIVPWQILQKEIGFEIRVIPLNDDGSLKMDVFESLLSRDTKLISLVHYSNTLGTINPITEVIRKAHAHRIPVLVDAAQSIAHTPIDVERLDVDFLVFSSHKMFGPTGTGVLYGKESLLEGMPPYKGGGDMISSVRFEGTTYNKLPYKFEAGTPHIAGVHGLSAAIDFIVGLGWQSIREVEEQLLARAHKGLKTIEGLRFIGEASEKTCIISFVMQGVHPHDISSLLDQEGIAIRAGHHCTQPIMDYYKVPATSRVSFSIYNTEQEIDYLIQKLSVIKDMF